MCLSSYQEVLGNLAIEADVVKWRFLRQKKKRESLSTVKVSQESRGLLL